jgi:hypothetical protein
MSLLDLQLEGPYGHVVTDKTFAILRDYLQPNSAMTLSSAEKSILDLLPNDDQYATDVLTFGEVCIEVVEQIPYYHPSQIKLARLLEHLGTSTKLTAVIIAKVRECLRQIQRYCS